MIRRTWMAIGVLAFGLGGNYRASALDLNAGGYGSYYDADEAGEGWGGGALVRLGIFDWLAVDARAAYLDLSDSDVSMVPLEAAAILRLPLMSKTLVPYGGVGVGYYTYQDSDLVKVDDGVGFFPVVGAELRFGSKKQWALFGEARWLFLSSDIESARGELTHLDGADLNGVGVNIGLAFRF